MQTGTILGYDPGGNGAHGVADLVVEGGKIATMVTATLPTTEGVIARAESHSRLLAVGIDTLSCWATGHSSWRPADLWLRDRYPEVRNSVVNPNYLSGAMCLNGMAVLISIGCRLPRPYMTETHPKVLFWRLSGLRYDYLAHREEMNALLSREAGTAVAPANEHEWDAAISALAAYRGLTGQWSNDLLTLPMANGGRIIAPCGPMHFCWPE